MTPFMVCNPNFEYNNKKDIARMLDNAKKSKAFDLSETFYRFATPEEAREYLDLLLELGQTFTADPENYRLRNNCDFSCVVRLITIAQIELTEFDKKHVLDYETPKFDSPYLNNAGRIFCADAMVDIFGEFWEYVECQREAVTEGLRFEKILDNAPKWRPVTRWWANLRYADAYKEARRLRAHICGIGGDSSRCTRAINENYQHPIEHAFPLVFYRSPLQAEQTFFEDAEIEAAIRAEWENSELHQSFSDEKLWRMVELNSVMHHLVSFTGPNGEECDTAAELRRVYPKFADLFGFSLPDDPNHCAISESTQTIARAVGAEKYLPEANMTCSDCCYESCNAAECKYSTTPALKTG